MDPLTTLSIADSVIRFVDFGSKLLSSSRQLYKSKDGVLIENVDIETITKDLTILVKGLRQNLPEHRSMTLLRPSEDDKALDALCRRSVSIAEELVVRLEKMKTRKKKPEGKHEEREIATSEIQFTNLNAAPLSAFGQNKRSTLNYDGFVNSPPPEAAHFGRWASFQKALEASWNRDEIEKLAATLREFRSEIEFRILISFRGALNDIAVQQSHTSHQLEQSTMLILDTFLNNRENLANQLHLQAEKLLEKKASAKLMPGKSMQKISQLLRGELDAVGQLQSSTSPEDSNIKETDNFATTLQTEEEIRIMMIESSILGSLSFDTLTERLESVELAYHNTFEWIFDESHASPRPWSNFVEWLRFGNGIYWINGKAGSGKSTLMRYIYENERTREELQKWAGSMPSEMSGYFFWRSGDREQRNQRGLLRSLLFETLQRHRALLPEISPDVWQTWSARATALMSGKVRTSSTMLPPEPKPWTMSQLKTAFRILLQKLHTSVKLCLFIDGLDEYEGPEGDYEDIVELFEGYANSPHIKICLSSRPLVVFERGFSECPNLKLQNLTYGDINHYVKDKLGTHKYMIQLSRQHAAQVSLLVDEIVEKASGVFLWVKLVVKSLLHGLRDYNRISDLQKRVRHLPADLEALYEHMLRYIDPFYHKQASKIFQIVRTAQKMSKHRVTLLTLSWAEDEDDNMAENEPINPLTTELISARCKMMDARLKSVCAGLLESIDVQFSDIAPDAKVLFLHRTVSDYFEKPEVWDRLISQTDGECFSPNLALLRSCVLQLKAYDPNLRVPLDMQLLTKALEYAKGAEADLDTGFPQLLDQLDIVASYQWRMKNPTALYHWSSGIEIPGIKRLGKPSTFFSLTEDIGLVYYVRNKYESGIVVDHDVNQHLLANEISLNHREMGAFPKVPDPILLKRIFHGGANPNFSYYATTPWEDAMIAAVSHFVAGKDEKSPDGHEIDSEWRRAAKAWAQTLKTFVEHGADPTLRTTRHRRLPGHTRLSPMLIVDEYFPVFLSTEAEELRLLLKEKVADSSSCVKVSEDSPCAKESETTASDATEVNLLPPSGIQWLFSWFRFITV